MKSRKLNLGCGKEILRGYLNLDLKKGEGVDVVHDLNKFPYPFQNNHFDIVNATYILEHLKDPIKTIRELHRITKKGGVVRIEVPHASNPVFWCDLTHVRPYSIFSMNRFDIQYQNKNSLQYLNEVKFRVGKLIIFSTLFKIFELIFNMNEFIQSIYEGYFSGIIRPRSVLFHMVKK